jgi:Mn-containing catalase
MQEKNSTQRCRFHIYTLLPIKGMSISIGKLANEIPKDKPDNLAANALREGLGGQFGEMRMIQYLFQNFNFRGKAKPYQDLLKSVAGEEIGLVELISTTINNASQWFN